MFDKQIIFTGKHAEYLRKLAKGSSKDDSEWVFQSNYEVLLIAPVIGFIYNRSAKAERDAGIKDNNIFLEAINRVRNDLEFTYRILMILHKKSDLSTDERLNRAFRYDRNDEKRKSGDEVFWGYVLGGIEVLYEKFIEESHGKDELVQNIYEFVESFQMTKINDFDQDSVIKLCKQAGI